jgi:hypothetical protein
VAVVVIVVVTVGSASTRVGPCCAVRSFSLCLALSRSGWAFWVEAEEGRKESRRRSRPRFHPVCASPVGGSTPNTAPLRRRRQAAVWAPQQKRASLKGNGLGLLENYQRSRPKRKRSLLPTTPRYRRGSGCLGSRDMPSPCNRRA